MIKTHALLYFGSRLSAAAANLAAVAIFSRLASAEVYGGSLLVFSWGFVIFGFCGQWLGASFFGLYRPQRAAAQIGAMARVSVMSVAAAALAIAIAAIVGDITWAFGGTVLATTVGLLAFVNVTEAERTRLDAAWVAVMYIARAGLIVTLGSVAVLLGGGSLALALALAAANALASVPGLVRLGSTLATPPDRAAVVELLSYGWPLVVAFGTMALGQNVDRLILVHVAGTGQLAAYGATSDFLKQGFGVFCEGITLASVSVAKAAATRGDAGTAEHVLEDAFRAIVVTIAFGAAFMTTFSAELADIVFGPNFREAARIIMPWMLLANATLVLRSFYFGQAIYFGQSSRNEAVSAFAMIGVTTVLSFVLIPRFGMFGAAVAATAGQVAACVVYATARPRMPIPAASAAVIAGAAALAFGAATLVDRSAVLGPVAGAVLKFLLLAAAAAAAIWRYDVLGMRDLALSLAPHRLLEREHR